MQLAKQQDCRVVAVCGGAEKGEFVRSLGADRVIDYRREDVGGVLDAEFPNALNLAVDTVSGTIYDAFLKNLANHGRLVVGGAASDLEGKPEIVTAPRIAHAIYYKGASVRGFMNGTEVGAELVTTLVWAAGLVAVFGSLTMWKYRDPR